MNNILVIAPHPDDETLGCGGTLLREKQNGAKIHWLIVTSILEKEGWKKDKILKISIIGIMYERTTSLTFFIIN